MAVEWDDPQLTPRERRIIARMEEEFGDHDSRMAARRAAERPGPLLFIGVAVAVQGSVLAFGISGPTPLAIAGYILIVVGLAIVWYELSPTTG